MIIPERINALIAVIEASNAINMAQWQTNYSLDDEVACTLEELHECGNQACIGGHLALMPEFRAIGGSVSTYLGRPSLQGSSGVNAVRLWLCEAWNCLEAQKIELLINGSVFNDEYGDREQYLDRWKTWKAKQAVAALKILRDKPELTLGEFYKELNVL